MPRNSAGTYTLPSGNPVVTGTLIESVWANTTMGDLGATLTDSLDRYGRGGMLAQLKLADGTAAAPAFAFNSEGSTGLFHPSAGVLAMSVLGIEAARMEASGATYQNAITAAAIPVIGAHLTNKTYVDSAINTAIGGGTLYVKRAGDTMTGALQVTFGAINGFRNYSGSATIGQSYALGRISAEAYFGIAGQAGNFTTGDVAGDTTLRADQRLWLSVGAAGYLRADAATGTSVQTRLNVLGSIGTPLGSGVQLGVASGQPIMQMSMLGGGVDSKHWDQYAGPSQMTFRILNDALNAAQNWMEVNRTGMLISSIGLPSGTFWVGNNLTGTKHKGAINGALNFPQATSTLVSGIIGSGNSDDVFTYDGKILSNYGLAWAMHSTNAAGPSAMFTSYGDMRFISSWADAMIIRGGLVGVGRAPVTHALEVRGTVASGYSTAEGLRITHDQAYIAFYNSANTARTGYIQYNTGGSALFAAEASQYFQFNIPAMAGALTINSTGVYNGPGAPSRLVKVGEFAASSTTAAIPGLIFRFGRVAATVGTSGTITFSSAMSSTFACMAAVEGAQGGGWIFRYYSVTGAGFTFAWDNYNTAGLGAACFIQYWAVGA